MILSWNHFGYKTKKTTIAFWNSNFAKVVSRNAVDVDINMITIEMPQWVQYRFIKAETHNAHFKLAIISFQIGAICCHSNGCKTFTMRAMTIILLQHNEMWRTNYEHDCMSSVLLPQAGIRKNIPIYHQRNLNDNWEIFITFTLTLCQGRVYHTLKKIVHIMRAIFLWEWIAAQK